MLAFTLSRAAGFLCFDITLEIMLFTPGKAKWNKSDLPKVRIFAKLIWHLILSTICPQIIVFVYLTKN